MNTNQEIICWLKENSSGAYRTSKDAAERLEACLFVIRELVNELPTNRDWLNPDLEKAAREILSWDNDQNKATASRAGSVRQSLAWPVGKFTVHDMPDEHEPCYLVCPDGLMIPFNAHATNGVDQARAQWFANTLNAALNSNYPHQLSTYTGQK